MNIYLSVIGRFIMPFFRVFICVPAFVYVRSCQFVCGLRSIYIILTFYFNFMPLFWYVFVCCCSCCCRCKIVSVCACLYFYLQNNLNNVFFCCFRCCFKVVWLVIRCVGDSYQKTVSQSGVACCSASSSSSFIQ